MEVLGGVAPVNSSGRGEGCGTAVDTVELAGCSRGGPHLPDSPLGEGKFIVVLGSLGRKPLRPGDP